MLLRALLVVLLLGVTLGAAVLLFPPARGLVRAALPQLWIVELNGLRLGYRVDHDVRITMPDGVRLAASLYLPRKRSERLGTIYVRHTYDRLTYGEGLQAAEFFASHGYAVLVQDVRGKFASGGEFRPYQDGTSDGVATLDWIVQQPWANGRVGTWGCSALGELQYVLARGKHPAHAAMVPIGAGGAMGSALGRYSYFGVFEGGIFQLASGFGWFLENGTLDSSAPAAKQVDIGAALRGLPLKDLVRSVRPSANNFESFISTALTDPFWGTLDYVSATDSLATPALIINTWGDQTVGDTLSLAEFARQTAASTGGAQQHVVIAPGTHCDHEGVGSRESFGELTVRNASQPYFEWYVRWFDYHLYGKGTGLADMPAYLYYMIGENRWLSSSAWPPERSTPQHLYLASDGHANGGSGDGRLVETPSTEAYDEYQYDPLNPVPSRGGAMCCTGNPADRQGPVDQRDIEARGDVLVYTSAPLAAPLRIAGPLRAHLTISSSARDTDFIARLVHVWPDGRSTTIQEGALRARYRQGIATPMLLEPGSKTEIVVDMRSIAYSVPANHRLRLHVTSSSFPRLERNLNTGGNNFDESIGVVATNRIHHGQGESFLELFTLSAD